MQHDALGLKPGIIAETVKDYYRAQCTNWLLMLLKSRLCLSPSSIDRYETSIARRWRL
jgi:hypothetical protein